MDVRFHVPKYLTLTSYIGAEVGSAYLHFNFNLKYCVYSSIKYELFS